jgi:hypothetical protein
MELRGTTGDDCKPFRYEGGLSARSITRSVGQFGVNLKDDVLKIQKLLNMIAPQDGGPIPATPEGLGLKEDGLCGPKTIGAIRNFQLRQGTGSDGRVDPNGGTLKRMNEVPKMKLQSRNASILAKVAMAMPSLIATADKAQKGADQAMGYLRSGGSSGLGFGKRAYELADLYFGFGSQPASKTLTELDFIRTTYSRARSVLMRRQDNMTGGSPLGISIFTIDPLGEPFIAYSPTQAGDDQQPMKEIHSGLIYLCERADTIPADLLTHVLFHEIIHFVDDETQGRNIDDGAKYRDKAIKASHDLKIRNADNYALFGTHLNIGRARLIASQPVLAPHIPAQH